MRVKYIKVETGRRINISRFPSFSATGSVAGMKKLFYGNNALLVKCGSYIYNVSSDPGIYYGIAY